MKLELKHLAPYLPYGLKLLTHKTELDRRCLINLLDVNFKNGLYLDLYKPILRPLSDLTKEMEHNGEIFIPSEKLDLFDIDTIFDIDIQPYFKIQRLFEWHFDVFGLIEKGLAIDINTLKK